MEAVATTAEGAAREQLFAQLSQSHPHVAAHQDRTEREIPIVVIDC
ncbi:nitroreductase/quinone reductase family protein [Amycolatopsis sp. GM8]|nr:nitroreductase/quinone reductase family protein [Amycolatopsis sp. GM8]